MIEEANDGASGNLAARIADCIAEADATGRYVVAAHLDAALIALNANRDLSRCATSEGKPLPWEQSGPRPID